MCDENGQCLCRTDISGQKCDKCKEGFYPISGDNGIVDSYSRNRFQCKSKIYNVKQPRAFSALATSYSYYSPPSPSRICPIKGPDGS